MNMLDIAQSSLAKFPKANKTAVENFICTLSGNRRDDIQNVALDTELYKWDYETSMAILFGIEQYYNSLN